MSASAAGNLKVSERMHSAEQRLDGEFVSSTSVVGPSSQGAAPRFASSVRGASCSPRFERSAVHAKKGRDLVDKWSDRGGNMIDLGCGGVVAEGALGFPSSSSSSSPSSPHSGVGCLSTRKDACSPITACSTDASPVSRCAESCCGSPSSRVSRHPEAASGLLQSPQKRQLSLPQSADPGGARGASFLTGREEQVVHRLAKGESQTIVGQKLRRRSQSSDVFSLCSSASSSCRAAVSACQLEEGRRRGTQKFALKNKSEEVSVSHEVKCESAPSAREEASESQKEILEKTKQRSSREAAFASAEVSASEASGALEEESAEDACNQVPPSTAVSHEDAMQRSSNTLQNGELESESDGWTPVESRRLRRWADVSLSDDDDLPFQRPEVQAASRRRRKVPVVSRAPHPNPRTSSVSKTRQASLLFFHSALSSALVDSSARLNVVSDQRFQRMMQSTASPSLASASVAAEGQRRRCPYTAVFANSGSVLTAAKAAPPASAPFQRAKWIFWHDSCGIPMPFNRNAAVRSRVSDNYGQGIRQIAVLELPSQVEGVLRVLTPLAQRAPANLSVCVLGVAPLWEDSANRHGGHFALRGFASRSEAQTAFSALLKELENVQRPTPHNTHKQRAPVHAINGVFLCLRKHERNHKVEVWVKPAHANVLRQLELWLSAVLQTLKPPPRADVDFLSHEDCLAKNKQRLRPPTRSVRSGVQTSPSIDADPSPRSPRGRASSKAEKRKEVLSSECRREASPAASATNKAMRAATVEAGSGSEASPTCAVSSGHQLVETGEALLSDRKGAEFDSSVEADENSHSTRGSRLSCSSLETAPSYKSVILRGTQHSSIIHSASSQHRGSFASSTSSSCTASSLKHAAPVPVGGVCTPQGALWDSASREALEERESPACAPQLAFFARNGEVVGDGEVGGDAEGGRGPPQCESPPFLLSGGQLPPREVETAEAEFAVEDCSVNSPPHCAVACSSVQPSSPFVPPRVFQPPHRAQQMYLLQSSHHHHNHHHHHHNNNNNNNNNLHLHIHSSSHFLQSRHQPHGIQQQSHRRVAAVSGIGASTQGKSSFFRELGFEEPSHFPTPAEAAAVISSSPVGVSVNTSAGVGSSSVEELRRQGDSVPIGGDFAMGFMDNPPSPASSRAGSNRKRGTFAEHRSVRGGSGPGGTGKFLSLAGQTPEGEGSASSFWTPKGRGGVSLPRAGAASERASQAKALFEHISCFNPTTLPDYFSMQQAAYQGKLAAAQEGAHVGGENNFKIEMAKREEDTREQQSWWGRLVEQSICAATSDECAFGLSPNLQELAASYRKNAEANSIAGQEEGAFKDDAEDASALLLLTLLLCPLLEIPAQSAVEDGIVASIFALEEHNAVSKICIQGTADLSVGDAAPRGFEDTQKSEIPAYESSTSL